VNAITQRLFGGRLRRLLWFFCVTLGIALAAVYLFARYVYYPSPALPRTDKRVLEWGWNTPRLQNMPNYLDVAQSLPFDGLILDIATPENRNGLSWTLFGDTAVDSQLLDELGNNFSGMEWGKLTDNFLRVNIAPANVDWFDDFDTIEANLEAIAHLAKQLGFKGIMFDTEHYGDMRPFDYQQQEYSDRHNYEEYDAQVFLRGQEIMEAFQRGYPGLTILYTFGLTIGSQPNAPRNRAEFNYGLLMPFIEGMIAAADEGTILVDAFEGSYIYRDELQFLQAYKLIKGSTRDSYARNPERYGQFFQAGFGLWLDHNYCGEPGLQPTGCPSGFTPETFQQAINNALNYSDRYVWIYSQGLNWYTGEGIPAEWKASLYSFGQ
jgi:hypothetical protein